MDGNMLDGFDTFLALICLVILSLIACLWVWAPTPVSLAASIVAGVPAAMVVAAVVRNNLTWGR